MPRDAALIAFVDALPRPTLLTDDQSRLMACNDLARELLGSHPMAPRKLDTLFQQSPPVANGHGRVLSLRALPRQRVRCVIRTIDGEGPQRFLVELEPLDSDDRIARPHSIPSAQQARTDEATTKLHRVLREVRQALRDSSATNICAYLDVLVSRARVALEVDTVATWFMVPDPEPCLVCFHSTDEGLGAPPSLSLAEIPGLHATVERDEMVTSTHVQSDDRVPGLTAHWLDARGVRSLISAPVMSGNHAIGTVLVESVRPRKWTAAECLFVSAISQLTTIVSEHVERRQFEQALNTRQSVLERVTTTLPAILYQYIHDDERPEYPYVAGRTQEIFGASPDDLRQNPQRIIEAVVPEDRYLVKRALRHSAETGRAFEVTVRARTPQGRLRWLHAHSMPDHQDGCTVWNGVISDITEVKRLESELRQAQKMEAIGQLAGGIAHDFNNLLMIINGSSEMLLETLPAEHVCYPLVEVIRRSGLRGAALTRRLLTFGRKQPRTPRRVDLNQTVAQTHSILPRLMGAHICCSLRLGESPCTIEADPVQIEQVLLNLAVNARDAMPEGGTLTIATERVGIGPLSDGVPPVLEPGPYVVLRVADTGTGMDATTQARIFEPFFTTKSADKGTGLGLATVYGAVKQNGGHLEVHSEPGRGTEFQIYLPAVEANAAHNGQEKVESQPGASDEPHGDTGNGHKRVLLVEDEPDVRQLLELQLVSEGYRVTSACDGQEAMSLTQDAAFDLLVTDITMPGISGIELARVLCESQPELCVLFMSGYLSPRPDLVEGAEFLLKPFSTTELRAALQRARRRVD